MRALSLFSILLAAAVLTGCEGTVDGYDRAMWEEDDSNWQETQRSNRR